MKKSLSRIQAPRHANDMVYLGPAAQTPLPSDGLQVNRAKLAKFNIGLIADIGQVESHRTVNALISPPGLGSDAEQNTTLTARIFFDRLRGLNEFPEAASEPSRDALVRISSLIL